MVDQNPGILIVDEDSAVRDSIAGVLGDAGLDFACASDGSAALESATDTSIGVVILGVRLPDMDGIKVLDRLRELRPSLRIIVLSGLDDEEMVLEALRNGACDYLAKPIHDEELILSARRAVESYALASRWTKLRGRLDRLVARMEELGAESAEASDEARRGSLERALVQGTSEVLEAEKTSYMRLDAEGRWLEVVACVGRRLAPGEFDPVEMGQGIAGGVLERGEALIVTDVATDARISGDHADGRYTSASFVAAPVEVMGSRLGVLCATDRVAGGAFSVEDLALLRLLAMQGASLLVGQTTHARPVAEAREVTTLDPDAETVAVLPKLGADDELDRDAELSRQICQAVTDEVEANRVIHEALRPVANLLPAAPVSIFLVDAETGLLRKEGECDGGVSTDRDELRRDRGLTGVVLQTGHLVATQDPASDPLLLSHWL